MQHFTVLCLYSNLQPEKEFQAACWPLFFMCALLLILQEGHILKSYSSSSMLLGNPNKNMALVFIRYNAFVGKMLQDTKVGQLLNQNPCGFYIRPTLVIRLILFIHSCSYSYLIDYIVWLSRLFVILSSFYLLLFSLNTFGDFLGCNILIVWGFCLKGFC